MPPSPCTPPPHPAGAKSLIAIQAPHLILNKPSNKEAQATYAMKTPMQGFAGMQVQMCCVCGGVGGMGGGSTGTWYVFVCVQYTHVRSTKAL